MDVLMGIHVERALTVPEGSSLFYLLHSSAPQADLYRAFGAEEIPGDSVA